MRPAGAELTSIRSPRVKAARQLGKRALRQQARAFLAEGPQAGLELIAAIEAAGDLDGYYLLPAARADLLRRLGRGAEAAQAYREALALTGTGPERRYLSRRLAEVTSAG